MTKDTQSPRMSARERSNSLRRKGSIDPATGQPFHYDHRRISHHDPARGRDPTPPPSKSPSVSWATLVTKYQLEGSTAIVMAMLGAHIFQTLLSSPNTPWTSIDWVSRLTALIPPFLWSSSTGEPRSPVPYQASSWIGKAFTLQYETRIIDPDTGRETLMYGKGWDDMYMVLLWIMIWTGLREGVMTHFYIPLGRYFNVGQKPNNKTKKTHKNQHHQKQQHQGPMNGSSKHSVQHEKTASEGSTKAKGTTKEEQIREGKLLRFAEQGWLVLYDGCMWTFGMIQLYYSPYWGDTRWFWLDYPKTLLSPTFKWYYLIQFAFWLQQLLLALIGIEKRRKDFLEFLIHHIITCLLVGFSYSFNLTSIGHAVLCAMDFSDIVLAACKMLKYMHKDQIADVGFVFFVITWIASRHYYFGKIIYSAWTEPMIHAEMGWDPSRGLFFTEGILNGFLFLLIALYCVLIFWLMLIFRVVSKVLRGENSEDVRSEDEEEEVEQHAEDEHEEEAGDEDDGIEVEEMEEMTFEVHKRVVSPAVDSPVDPTSGIKSINTHAHNPAPEGS
ncbi:sphingosine N-acyltransferase lag1 [Actinomortierella wolfii]|nr:sphingosine N-acyltransferase lag1 [Actinomortierella wolfii]